jgi:hypothetical protein
VNFNGDQDMQVKKTKAETSLKEEKRQNDTSMKRIGTFIIIASVVLIGSVIGSLYIGRNLQGDKTPRENSELRVKKMGQGIKVGQLVFAAWDARWYENSSNKKHLNVKPDSCYLLIEMTLRNDSNRRSVKPLLILMDDRGFYYEPSKKWFMGAGNMYKLNHLNPGVSKDGYIVFDVPKDSQYKLKVSDHRRTNSYALIQIKPRRVVGPR